MRYGKLAALGVLAGLTSNLQAQLGLPALRFKSAEELRTGARFQGGHYVPRWWNGVGLVGTENDGTAEPVIYVAGRDGREDVRFGLGDGSIIDVHGTAGGADGALAIVGEALGQDWHRESFVARISPDRQQRTVTRLGPYHADGVAIAADGMVWTSGFVVENDRIQEHRIMRRFDRSGRLLGEFLPNTAISVSSPSMGSYLLPSPDRMGWYFPHGNGYMEFSLEGKLIGRFVGAVATARQSIEGVALSDDDNLVVTREDYAARPYRWEIFSLNRERRTWMPVLLVGTQTLPSGAVLGFDGENLLTSISLDIISSYKPVATR